MTPTLKYLFAYGVILGVLLRMTVHTSEVRQRANHFTRSPLLDDHSLEQEVIGSEDSPVKVYIKVHNSSPPILCATPQLRSMELMDPNFSWQGPRGMRLSNRADVKISLTGTLIIENFHKELSGVYECTIYFYSTGTKSLQSLDLKYVLYAYVDPDYTYEFQAQYHAADCHNTYNSLFLKRLITALNQLTTDLAYTISIHKSRCHTLKVPLAGIQYELFLTLKLHLDMGKLASICEKSLRECDHNFRLEKARHRVETFFTKQAETYREIFGLLPFVYYIDGTLQVIRVDRCKPGFGKDHKKHPMCPECCVVCSPGTYGTGYHVSCLPCSEAIHYGESDCDMD
ncbi:zona pellucida-binding protein 1-like [Hemitrygon akajei]|uniref:zona pellucida-binding protein 1-like n=1 Tax=Hemitrygon akajei TaxID=2704970 RepID=UPI003BF970D0